MFPNPRQEYRQAYNERPVTEICTNKVCKLPPGSKHNNIKEHLSCKRKQQRHDHKQTQEAPQTAPVVAPGTAPVIPVIPVLEVPQEVLEIGRSQFNLMGRVPEMVEEIATKGYTIQHFHKVDAHTVEILKQLARTDRESEGIDNEGEALKETPKADAEQCRRALPLTPDIPNLVGLFIVLKALVTACGPSIFNTWRVLSGPWNLLFNNPPCPKQVDHKDYDAVVKGSAEDNEAKKSGSRKGPGASRDKALPLDQMPLSVLFSVEDNTYWYAGDQKFHLPAGSFVIFRGDVEHAGAEYDEFSVRLHAYFDHNCISTPLRFTRDTLEKAIFYTRKHQA